MLKGKGAIYILIPVNILVWGFFIYRFYTAYTEGDVTIEDSNTQVIKLDELKDSIDYKLSLSYKDPFLREGEKRKEHSSNNSKTNNPVQKEKVVKTPTVSVPKIQTEIKYFGLVKNNTTGISTALISINGQTHLVKKGDVINGITIKSISNETIELKEGKNIQVIHKN
jgi:Tfp pilus assembly protein PilP